MELPGAELARPLPRGSTLAVDAVLALAATAWFAWFGAHSFDVLHDGVMFKAAVDVARAPTSSCG